MGVVKEIDHGLRRIAQEAHALSGSGVKVGFQSNQVVRDGTDSLDIAIWNHYGTENIPPRPFMTKTLEKYGKDIQRIMAHLAIQVTNGANVEEALRTLGEAHRSQIIAMIRSGDFTPNAPSTIRRKGSDVPLVDEGRHLIPGIQYVLIHQNNPEKSK